MNITQERLKQIVNYDPKTGVFTWIVAGAHRGIGKKITTLDKDGYVRFRIDRANLLASRLAFLYMNGTMPIAFVDHINGDISDNRWCNLREADASINQHNRRRARRDSTNGLIGVARNGKRFMARIHVDWKPVYIGTFDTPQQAHEAYVKAKRQLHEGCTL